RRSHPLLGCGGTASGRGWKAIRARSCRRGIRPGWPVYVLPAERPCGHVRAFNLQGCRALRCFVPPPLTPSLAKKIIRQLAAGTTPLEGVPHLNVGRERYFAEISRLLDDLTEGDGADVHFLNADYGH